jgi:hypothetical protein
MNMDILKYNREAWDSQVDKGNMRPLSLRQHMAEQKGTE